MATTKKSNTKKVSTKEETVEKETSAKNAQVEAKKEVPKKVKKVTLDEFIDVQSCVVGKLVWRSKKTGYKVIWNEYGEINPMQVSDLLDMRNDSRGMFTSNWIVLVGDRAKDILDYLQVSKFYKQIVTPEDLDDIILGDAEDIESSVRAMNDSLKEAVVFRATQLYKDGEIDSAKTINAIRKATGVDISL